MPTRIKFTVFITLLCLTFIIQSSSTILAKYISIDSKVEAKTVESFIKTHRIKTSDLEFKKTNQLTNNFFTKETDMPVYLTFDDGPTKFTSDILHILNKHGVQSTFFMLNNNIENLPELVKLVANSGHTIGCHGVTHIVSRFYRTDTSPSEEMTTCAKSVENVTSRKVQVVRVPYGSSPHLSSAQKGHLEKAQFIMWDWNVDSMDWSISSSEKMVQSVMNQVKRVKENGRAPVILFHDTNITVQALPQIIKKLKSLGYEFKPITVYDDPIQFTLKK